jgi:uncharacterized protein (DUF2164 family)
MRQTAVQWYAERLYDLEMAYNQGVIKTNTYIKGRREAVEQAKEMEKEQIIDALLFGDVLSPNTAETYYNQTYGGNK